MPQQGAGSRSDKLLLDQKVYITRWILIVRSISHKRCSKSDIALFLSNTHWRWFYSLVNYGYNCRTSRHRPTVLSWVNRTPVTLLLPNNFVVAGNNSYECLIDEAHVATAHVGLDKTMQYLADGYQSQSASVLVRSFVVSCNACQLVM